MCPRPRCHAACRGAFRQVRTQCSQPKSHSCVLAINVCPSAARCPVQRHGWQGAVHQAGAPLPFARNACLQRAMPPCGVAAICMHASCMASLAHPKPTRLVLPCINRLHRTTPLIRAAQPLQVRLAERAPRVAGGGISGGAVRRFIHADERWLEFEVGCAGCCCLLKAGLLCLGVHRHCVACISRQRCCMCSCMHPTASAAPFL